MTLTRPQVESWMWGYKTAWETRNPQAIASLFTPDGTYRETPADAPMRGIDEICRYWQDNVHDRQADITFDFEVWAVSGNGALAHWIAEFTWTPSGERRRLDGIFRLVFAPSAAEPPQCLALEEWWHETVIGRI